jgi:galactoside O-acetyltransferase
MDPAEVARLGFAAVGRNVRLSRFARWYRPDRIRLGDEIRVDDFALLSPGSGGIELEGFNHVAAGVLVFGDLTMRPWSTLSSRVAIYGTSDDFGVDGHTYPHVDAGRRVVSARVEIGSRVVIGTGSTVLPGVTIVDGVSVGAMSLVTHSIDAPGVYAGVPVRWLRDRRPADEEAAGT